MFKNPLGLPRDWLRNRISLSATPAKGLARSSVSAIIAAGLVFSDKVVISATTSSLRPDRDVATSNEFGVISPGLAMSWRASVQHTSRPPEVNRRQLGSAATCDAPVPVRMIRSWSLRSREYRPSDTGALPKSRNTWACSRRSTRNTDVTQARLPIDWVKCHHPLSRFTRVNLGPPDDSLTCVLSGM